MAEVRDFHPLCAEPMRDLIERPWKPGLPPGPATPEMVARYEVFFSPGGRKWHREKAAQ